MKIYACLLAIICAFTAMWLGLAIFLVMVIFPLFAYGHGDAGWISKMQLGCCGTSDCAIAPDGTWERTNQGYFNKVTNELILFEDAKQSIDEHYWECRYFSGPVPSGRIRDVIGIEGGKCLFVPSVGM